MLALHYNSLPLTFGLAAILSLFAPCKVEASVISSADAGPCDTIPNTCFGLADRAPAITSLVTIQVEAMSPSRSPTTKPLMFRLRTSA